MSADNYFCCWYLWFVLEGLFPHQIAYLDRLGWRKTKLGQKQGIRLNICVMLRLTQAFRSLGIFECLLHIFSWENISYSIVHQTAFVCTTLLTKLCGSPALFRDTLQQTQSCQSWFPFRFRFQRRCPRVWGCVSVSVPFPFPTPEMETETDPQTLGHRLRKRKRNGNQPWYDWVWCSVSQKRAGDPQSLVSSIVHTKAGWWWIE